MFWIPCCPITVRDTSFINNSKGALKAVAYLDVKKVLVLPRHAMFRKHSGFRL